MQVARTRQNSPEELLSQPGQPSQRRELFSGESSRFNIESIYYEYAHVPPLPKQGSYVEYSRVYNTRNETYIFKYTFSKYAL